MDLSQSMRQLGSSLLAQVDSADTPSTRTDVEEALRWLNFPPGWVAVLVLLPAVITFVVYFYRRERPTGHPGWKWVLGTLRVIAIIFALLMLAQPVRHKKTFEERDSTILILVDDSLSQDMADRYSDRRIPEGLSTLFGTSTDRVEEMTRYELVRRFLSDADLAVIDKLREKGKVAITSFAKSPYAVKKLSHARASENDEESEVADGSGDADGPDSGKTDLAGNDDADGLEDTPSLPEGFTIDDGEYLPPYAKIREDPRVQETRVAEGLRDAVAAVLGMGFGKRQERVSGVLLFSDFQQNADTISAVDVARRLGERKCPVFTIGVGNPDEPKDIRLLNVDVQDVVLVDDPVDFTATISADGFDGERVRIDLTFGDHLVKTEHITLLGGGQQQRVRLNYQPKKPGKFTATVDVERLGGEVFSDNNSITKTITVLDEKIKVLYAEHLPRWEYRFLSHALCRDKTVEAQVFLFSADSGFPHESSPGIPSLDAFPRERADLFQYHVIILGDVDPIEHLDDRIISLLNDFVAEGGGLILIAGPHANPSRYRTIDDLYNLVPVIVPNAGVFEARKGPITDVFNVKLTADGRRHPVMRLDVDPDENIRLWENDDGQFYDHLPGFFWFFEAEGAKPGARVLARHPTRTPPLDPDGKPLPIFAFMNYGKGKTFFSAVDTTWRWRAGVGDLYSYRLWGQVTRFVASGRLLGKTPRYQISTDKGVYDIGEAVRIEATVFDANMRPSDEPSLTVYHQRDGTEGEPPTKIELYPDTSGEGVFFGPLNAAARGVHDVWIGTESERLAFTTFSVEVPALEARDTRLNRVLARRIADVSGGAYVDLPDALDVIEKIEGVTRMEDGVIENDDLWDEDWVIWLIVSILAAEWVLRKLVRLV